MSLAEEEDGTVVTYSAAINVSTIFGLLTKHGGERVRQFELEYGVRFKLTHANGYVIKPQRVTRQLPQGYCGTTSRDVPVFLRMYGTRTALQIAVPVFRTLVLDDPAAYRILCHARWNEKVRFFVSPPPPLPPPSLLRALPSCPLLVVQFISTASSLWAV